MDKTWAIALMQFPMKFAENLARMQIEQAEEYVRGLGLPPAMLFFHLEGLKACRQAVQAPAVFFGHQEHFKH